MKNKNKSDIAMATILIVEDSPTQLEQLRFLLEEAGYSVVAAKNGREGLEKAHANTIDLVISDIVMPEMDGYSLCKTLREDKTLRQLPVILLTSLTDPQDVIRGLESGANNFICKPYEDHMLLARVHTILANNALRCVSSSEMGINIFFAGQRFNITADRLQILDLLLSTYENAVNQNKELINTRNELRILNEHLEQKVQERTKELTEEVTIRQQAEERERHVNRVLRAISSINQLIVREKDPARLIRQACEMLVETRGYRAAWISLDSQNGSLPLSAQSTCGKELNPSAGTPPSGDTLPCRNVARAADNGIAILDPHQICEECPLLHDFGQDTSAVALLRHGGREFGMLGVCLAEGLTIGIDELSVLVEVSGDLGLALHGIATERKRRESEEQFQQLYHTMAQGVLYQERDGHITQANPAAERILGLTLDQLRGRTSLDPRWKTIHEDGSDYPGDTHPSMIALHTGKTAHGIMGIFNPTDNDYRWVSVTAMPEFRDNEHTPYRVFTTFEDITGIRQASEEIKRLSKFPSENKNPVLRIGPDSTILYANEASEELLAFWDTSIGGKAPKEICKLARSKHERSVEIDLGNRTYIMQITPVVGEKYCNIYGADITKRKESERRRELTTVILSLLNRGNDVALLIRDILRLFKKHTGIEAVGIRLRQGEDFPYYETNGFAPHFVETDSHLCVSDETGAIIRDNDGNPVLDCMCGNVIQGRFDPSKPFYTPYGSFWTNSTTELLASTTGKDRQDHMRDRCNGEGYESVALIPVRSGDTVIGLLQFNDHRKGVFTLERIEFYEEISASIGIAVARQHTKKLITSSEKRYRRLFEAAQDGILILDAQSGKIIDVNPFLVDLLGYSRETFLGKELWEIGLFKNIVDSKESFLELQKKGYIRFDDMPLKTASGRSIAVEFVSNVYEVEGNDVIQCNIRDISERKLNEEKIAVLLRDVEEERERLSVVINSIPDEVWFSDTNKRFILANESAQKEFGLADGETIGVEELTKSLEVYRLDGSPRPVEEASSLRALAGEIVKNQEELVRTPSHGELRYRQVNASPVRNAAGTIVGAISVIRDITDLKQIEKKVRENEEKFRMISASAQDAIIMMDDEGKISFWNESAQRIFGYSSQEAVGVDLHTLIVNSDYNALFRKGFAAFRTTGKGASLGKMLEMEAIKKNGDVIPVEVSLSSVQLKDNWHAIGIIRDISARKQSEQSLRESEERYRELIDNISSGVAIYEGRDDGNDFVVKDFNKAGERIDGDRREDIIGKSIFEIRPGIEEFGIVDVFRRVFKTGMPEHVPAKLYHDERISKWYENFVYRLTTGEIVTVFDDITDRKLAEDKIAHEQILLRTIIDNIPISVYAKDTECRIVLANALDLANFDKPESEVIGHTDAELLPEKIAAKTMADDLSVTRDGQRVIDREELIVSTTGESRWLLTSKIPWRDREGNIVGLVGIGYDITERKEAEEEKVKVQARLLHSEKMEAIGTLAGGIAHDFNNILSAILGYSELALSEAPEGSQVRSDLEKILVAGNRAKGVVNQILTFSRQQEHGKTPLSIAPLVKEVVKFLQASLPSTIRIETDISTQTGPVMADPTQIHQIIMNLGTNAMHAMKKAGGILTIQLENSIIDNADTAKSKGLTPGRYTILRVTDTGHGMTPDLIGRIFEPYYTTKAPGEGSGLGLSIIHGIVLDAQGAIDVQSEPGKGSTFTVYLPVTEQETVAAVKAENVVFRGLGRILFVDDESAIVEVGSRILSSLGYEVVEMTSSVDALEYFQEHPTEIDLVISDVTMPFIPGDELAREILAIRPDMPIIICSGYSDRLSLDEWEALGITEYLAKPLLKSDLSEKVHKVLMASKKDGDSTF